MNGSARRETSLSSTTMGAPSRTRHLGRAVGVSSVALALGGCSLIQNTVGSIVSPPGRPIIVDGYRVPRGAWWPDHLVAGVSRIDITPPPGFATGGHGPAGGLARGYWTRLYARAFFFADPQGHPLILVTCDLFAVPGGLAREVGRRIALQWGDSGLSVSPEAVIVAATHTHQGPGNFLTAGVFNAYGSKYPGFDRRLFSFLVDRVTLAASTAIADGYVHKEPAVILRRTAAVPHPLQLNRSPRTYMANWNATRLMDALHAADVDCTRGPERDEARLDWDLPNCPRLRATDPTMTVLDVVRGADSIGRLIFFAVHPTVLIHTAGVYSSDFVGHAVTAMEEARAARGGARVVVGFFNGGEGDVTARRGARDLRDVLRVSRDFRASVEFVESTQPADVPVPRIVTRQAILRPGHSRLPKEPMVGAPALGGGENDRTVLYLLGWRGDLHEIPAKGQGGKLGALEAQLVPGLDLTPMLAPPRTFPTQIPVGYVELGAFALGTVPAEPSTATAAMIRDSLGSRGAHGAFELISLANEYSAYIASPDEYEMQDYMGGMTVWGPREGPIFAWALQCLQRMDQAPDTCPGLTRHDPSRVPRMKFSPGPPPPRIRGFKLFGPTALGEAFTSDDDEMSDIVRDSSGQPARNLPIAEWTECITGDSAEFAAAASRTISILELTATGWTPRAVVADDSVSAGAPLPDDDRGSNFLTVMRSAPPKHGPRKHQRRMAAVWLAPILERGPLAGRYKFRLTTRTSDGSAIDQHDSPEFQVQTLPAARRPPVQITTPACPAA